MGMKMWQEKCWKAASVVTLAAVLNGCNGSDNGGGPNPSPTATPRATAQATPTTAPVTVGNVTGTYSLGNGAERGTVILRNVRQNGTATGTIASPALQNPAPLSGTITNGRLTAQSTAQPDRNGRPTVYVIRGIVITVNANALVIKPHDVDINSGVVEKRQAGALVASGSLSVQQIPAVNPYVGRKTGNFTITTGFGAGQSGPLAANVTNDGTITATFNVPTSGGVVRVAISGIVDAATGQVTIIGTNTSSAAGTLILSLSGRLVANSVGTGTFNLSRLQSGVATTVSSGTFRLGVTSSTPTPTATQPGGGGNNQFAGNYSGAVTVSSESPPKTGNLTFTVNSNGSASGTLVNPFGGPNVALTGTATTTGGLSLRGDIGGGFFYQLTGTLTGQGASGQFSSNGGSSGTFVASRL